MRDLILTAVVCMILPVALLRPWIGVLAFFWISFMNPHKLAWGFATSMPFALLIGSATLIGLVLAKDRKNVPWTAEVVLMCLLAIYFTFTSFFAWAPHEAWAYWNKVVKIILMTLVMGMLIHGRNRIYYFLMTVVLSIGFYGAKGGVHSLISGGSYNIYGPEGSFIGSNNTLGLALCMILPLTVFFAREEKRVWFKRLLLTVAVLSTLATLFTYSRGAMLGLATVLILMFMRSKAKIWALIVFVPLLYLGSQWAPDKIFKRAELIETYQQDRSAMQRLQSWSVAWNLAKDHPLTGAGFEYEYSPNEERWLSYANRKYDEFGKKSRAVHSSYFEVLGQHGYIAWALFLLMLSLMLLRLNRLRLIGKQIPELAWAGTYAEGMLISMAGFLVVGLFVNAAYFDLMYAYLMMGAILQREVKQHVGPQSFSTQRMIRRIPATGNQPYDNPLRPS